VEGKNRPIPMRYQYRFWEQSKRTIYVRIQKGVRIL
jgi:hypothetical protein